MAEVAAVGWAISVLGWVASPVSTRLLNDEGFDEAKKLRDLEARLLPQLALMRERAERIPQDQRPHFQLWANRLRSAFYDAEDILDVADYYRLHRKVNFPLKSKKKMQVNLQLSQTQKQKQNCTKAGVICTLLPYTAILGLALYCILR
uniref:Disease resistance N-terminal domain-containing protein n=1 Tax=Arundo donax TaxID=35708 RepID=A0A0A8Z6R5_ARUDO